MRAEYGQDQADERKRKDGQRRVCVRTRPCASEGIRTNDLILILICLMMKIMKNTSTDIKNNEKRKQNDNKIVMNKWP